MAYNGCEMQYLPVWQRKLVNKAYRELCMEHRIYSQPFFVEVEETEDGEVKIIFYCAGGPTFWKGPKDG